MLHLSFIRLVGHLEVDDAQTAMESSGVSALVFAVDRLPIAELCVCTKEMVDIWSRDCPAICTYGQLQRSIGGSNRIQMVRDGGS